MYGILNTFQSLDLLASTPEACGVQYTESTCLMLKNTQHLGFVAQNLLLVVVASKCSSIDTPGF